jgi:LysW-gamma-L-lysine carboxypeptidase
MAAHGLDAGLDAAGNAVGTRGAGPRQVLLLGHIDTFPGELPVRRDGDWLYGRGTVDAKGPLCAFAAAAAALDVPAGWRVTVVGAVEEEAATSRGARHLLARWPAPAACIIGEPSGWERITLGYKGRLLVEVALRAPFAHSAGQARPPAEQAVELWNAVVAYCAAFNAGREAAFDRLDPTLYHIATQDEGAYGAAQLSLGFRLPPDVEISNLKYQISNLESANQQVGKSATFNVRSPISNLYSPISNLRPSGRRVGTRGVVLLRPERRRLEGRQPLQPVIEPERMAGHSTSADMGRDATGRQPKAAQRALRNAVAGWFSAADCF